MASLARASAAAIRVWWARRLILRGRPDGGLEEGFFGGGIEERDLGAGEAEPMREVARGVRRG